MNLPNKLTIGRILLIPLIIIIYSIEPLRNMHVFEELHHLSVCNLLILIITFIGAMTDLIDGKYARKHNMVTDLGKFLDPLADKLLVVTLLMIILDQCNYFAIKGGETTTIILKWWMVWVILAREFMVTGIRLVAAGKKTVIAANWYGKVKTTLQFITILFLLAGCAILENPETAKLVPYSSVYVFIVNTLIIATLAVTIFSGADYLIKNISVLEDPSMKKKKKSR